MGLKIDIQDPEKSSWKVMVILIRMQGTWTILSTENREKPFAMRLCVVGCWNHHLITVESPGLVQCQEHSSTQET